MKILIDIPEEFKADYTTNKFKEFFERVIADMNTLCGTYICLLNLLKIVKPTI